MEKRLLELLRGEDWSDDEATRLVRLIGVLTERDVPPAAPGVFDRYLELRDLLLERIEKSESGDAVEESFLELYAHLHMHEASYTRSERRRMDETGGYWSHAGGVSPILKAAPFISEATISADLGAGNGLQGLLFQKLYPHARTIQVEISSNMVEIGRSLQSWLRVAEDRVEWVVGDVLEASVSEVSFLYLYRPVRPEGIGHAFYKRLARELAEPKRDVVVFSIADCLRFYLDDRFEAFYRDGHLTCMRRKSG